MTPANGPTKISHILDTHLSAPGFEKIVKGFSIYKLWQKTVGPKIAARALPLKLSEKKLYVTVATSIWMEELKYLKEELIQKLNRELKENPIDDIIFRLGKIGGQHIANRQSTRSSANQKISIQLSQREMDDIERLINPVKDQELKETIRRAIINRKRLGMNNVSQ